MAYLSSQQPSAARRTPSVLKCSKDELQEQLLGDAQSIWQGYFPQASQGYERQGTLLPIRHASEGSAVEVAGLWLAFPVRDKISIKSARNCRINNGGMIGGLVFNSQRPFVAVGELLRSNLLELIVTRTSLCTYNRGNVRIRKRR